MTVSDFADIQNAWRIYKAPVLAQPLLCGVYSFASARTTDQDTLAKVVAKGRCEPTTFFSADVARRVMATIGSPKLNFIFGCGGWLGSLAGDAHLAVDAAR